MLIEKVKSNKKTVASVVGATAAAILLVMVPQHEGTILKGYLDPVGIPTKCMGDTNNVVVGQRYTEAECLESLETQLIAHAEPVLKCTPVLKDHPYQLAAAVDFAYNVGVSAYCKSSIAKEFNKGDFKTACKRFNESATGQPQWVWATKNGKKVMLQGLVIRRKPDRDLCEYGLY